MSRKFVAGLLLPFAFAALPATAQEPFRMEMPLRCSPGIDCWIVNYVDMDPTLGVSDYMCSNASYDTHKGTDIAVMDASVMREGVEVYASATGIVRGVRNDMRDIDFNQGGGPSSVEGKECGNGILLDHGNGWTTQYCHMLRGSVIVAKDDEVEAGQTIGLVGLSGLTEFPHVHIQVKHNEQVVDPFAGLGRTKKCGIGKAPLWKTNALLSMLYEPTALYSAGFSSTTPNVRIAREGLYGGEVLFEKSPVIALWTDMFWVNRGDKLQFIITGPEGQTMLAHTTTLKKKEARRFAYAGINRSEEPWPKGAYTGEIRLIRPGSDEEYSVVKVINVN
ncbi:MAG: M23 family metallopeptidase [Rhodospirillaceae bacterium]|nr:M23 family metallopeptidase [Rhodospirillaceae bacterium]MBT5244100.1 M23 family metallopeptidase [Rhodospirillaceae bacterium]MBT5560920.1 M23 family metallopeptidase [Rhodospirillaceae bacterium]MBT6241209.1 M23 family metallopeptidase [Rhodospirillaceae bacterium]MBT7136312.1 M23 family metallopeptidase [Rhodospirillaceae bacterium]